MIMDFRLCIFFYQENYLIFLIVDGVIIYDLLIIYNINFLLDFVRKMNKSLKVYFIG